MPSRLPILLASFALAANLAAADAVPRDGLVLWFDGAHVEMKDANIEQLTDLSGKGNHAVRLRDARHVLVNPTVAKDAANGQPVLRFDGRNSSFAFREITDIRTVVWVVRKDASAFKQKQELFVLGGAKSLDFHPGTHFTDTITHATPQYGARDLQEGKAWLNGVPIDPRKTDFPQKLSVITLQANGNVRADQVAKDRQFPDRCWHGDIAEILLFNRPLTDAERIGVEAALRKKYSIQ